MQIAFTAICIAIIVSLLRKAWVAETMIRKIKLVFTAVIMAYFTIGLAAYPSQVQKHHIDYIDSQVLSTINIIKKSIKSGEGNE